MSFREMRNFTECMRSLGYAKLVAMDSFRTANFELVSDILRWLVKRYDHTIDIPDDLSTETDRVLFVKSIAQHMATKAHIKINTRKIYGADGYAVKELLKIATVLQEALDSAGIRDDGVASGANQIDHEIPQLDIASKIANLKTCRTLATDITARGAELYDLLGKEIELREVRISTISRPLELDNIENSVKSSIGTLFDQVQGTRNALDNLSADEANLEAKIEKKKQELDRHEKRLRSLQSVRPAYMDEYDRLEVDLQKQYAVFMEKYRNLTFLEQQLEEYNRAEQDKFEETESTLKKMQNRLREEELRLLRGGDDDEQDDEDGDGADQDEDFELESPARKGNSRPQGAAGKRVTGSMEGGSDSESEDTGKTVNSDEENISIGSGDSASMLGEEEIAVGGDEGSENEEEDVEVDEDDDDQDDDEDAANEIDDDEDNDDDIPVSRHHKGKRDVVARGHSDDEVDQDFGSNGSDNDF